MSDNIDIKMNMFRPRAKKSKSITDEMWNAVLPEHKRLVDEFLQVNSQLSIQSRKQYKSGLRQFFYWVYEELDNKPMYEITKRDFLRYLSHYDIKGMSSDGKSFKKSCVSSLCNYIEAIIADDDEKYESFRNFTKNLPAIPKNQVYDKVKITKKEYDLIIDTLLQREDYMGVAWVATAFNTGARRSEILQFKTEIIDYPIPEGQNYALSNIVRGKGSSVDGKPLRFMVNLEALKYIKLWINKREYPHEYIFTNKNKEQISKNWANDFCSDILSPILNRRVNPHIFKASCITYLLETGVDIKLVSKYVAQHEDVATTSSFYDLRDFEEERNKIF